MFAGFTFLLPPRIFGGTCKQGRDKMKTLDELKREIINGNYLAFLHSGYWKRKRIDILDRDHYECQRCKGIYDGGYPIKHPTITRAVLVHHKVPAKENLDLILDDDNLVSLCWLCHEIIEGRINGNWKPKKKRLTEEKW